MKEGNVGSQGSGIPIDNIYHLYATYILDPGGLYATYHLLWEPETTIDILDQNPNIFGDHKIMRDSSRHGLPGEFRAGIAGKSVMIWLESVPGKRHLFLVYLQKIWRSKKFANSYLGGGFKYVLCADP